MRIVVTGKGSFGYTLLEILAVLSLIGLLLALAYPRVYLSEEKTELKLIGDLLAADLRQLREAALTEQTETVLGLEQSGYSFTLGGIKLERDYKKFQLAFAAVSPTEGTPESSAGIEPVVTKVIFKPDGSCNQLSSDWQTAHFRGTMQINETGVLKWSYAPK